MSNFNHTIFLFLLVVFCFSASAQDNFVSDRIKKIVDEATNQIKKQQMVLEKIKEAEDLAQTNNNPIDYFRIYKAKALFYYDNKNYADCKIYTNKFKRLIHYCVNPVELAKTYEMLFIFEYRYNKDAIIYLLKANNLFKKHGKSEDLIDVNFNLTIQYKNKKDWYKSIEHANNGLGFINSSGQKKGRAKFLYLYLVESYAAVGDYAHASLALITADSIRQGLNKIDDFNYQYLYYKQATSFYKQSKQYQKAAEISDDAFKSLFIKHNSELKKVNDAFRLEKELKTKNEDLRRIRAESELKNSRISIDTIVIISITILLIFLTLLSFYLKRYSKKIKAFNLDLEQKNMDLASMATKLEDALKAKTDFLSVMTHELFTPINGINIISQNLKTETNAISFKQSLELLEFSSNYLHRLMKNIIDAKFIESNDLKLNVDVVNFKSFITSVAQGANFFLKTSTNKFQHFIDAEIPSLLLIDSVKLSQILINLLNNANKFTSNGNISFHVKLEEESHTKAKILFEIIDTGIGVDSTFVEHIFDKFSFGSEEIKRKYGGSGIGLYVVKHFLLLHNSQIQVHSEKEKTTKFSFSIWFDKVIDTKQLDKNSSQNAKKILLVDDNKVNLVVTKRLLESNGFSCDAVESGLDSLEMLKKNKYDLILMDIMMPGINGFEAANKIKQSNIQTPIIALTAALDIEQNNENFNQADFIAVLAKPLIPDEFIKIVKKITSEY